MDVAHYAALRAHCSELSKTFFVGVTHAPTIYATLGRSLDNVSFSLERLYLETNPNSPILEGKSRRSTEKVLWLSLFKLSTLLGDIESLLRRLNVSKDKQPQWWLNFANKARFSYQESFTDLIHRLDFHNYALHMTIRTFNRDVLSQKVATFNAWATALGTILHQQVQLASSGLKSEVSSIYSASDAGPDILQEFATASDYNGRDIFEAAKLMVMVRLATFWAHRGKDDLWGIEKSKVLSVAAYGNLLKAGWILQRLQCDQRSRTDECTAIIVMLSEDVTFELRKINELKLILPTNEQLVQEMDVRIWLDDLEEIELNKKSPTRTVEVTGKDSLAENVRPLVSPALKRENSAHWRNLSQDKSRTPAGSVKRSSGSARHGKSPSQASLNETIMASSDSRATNITAPSSIDTQPSMFQSPQSPHLSPVSNSLSRKPLPKTTLPTVTEPTEQSRPQPSTLHRRATIPPDSMQYGVPPLHAYSNDHIVRETRIEEEPGLSSKISSSSLVRKYLEHSLENISDLQPYDPANPPSQFYDYPRSSNPDAAPPPPDFGDYPRTPNYEPAPFSPVQDSRDLDERPGEVEVMKHVFQGMLLFASDSFDSRPIWEGCSIRIFRKSDVGVRLVTYRDSGIDQRFISLKETEIVPEYGYHKDEPVLYLRRCRPDSYQAPPASRPSNPIGTEDLSAISLYYRFDNSEDMFNFQMAFTGEAVEIDIQAVRTVRFKRSLLDGEHSNYKARVQLWHEQTFTTVGSGGDPLSPVGGSISGTIRSRGVAESMLKVPSTRLVIFFEEIIIMLFVTDSVAIEARARTNVIRIKPSSYRTFGNPSSVRARFLGDRSRSGGIKLDKRGLTIDCEDSFDEFKWFEIDFFSEQEMSYFRQDFINVINDRRKERRRVEELKHLAANGIRSAR